MKQIYFGYNKKNYLDSGIEGRVPYVGEYLDIVEINGRNYLFTKGVSEVKNSIIDVREIIQDVYIDGSYVVYANAYRTQECRDLEKAFNIERYKVKAETGISLIPFFDSNKVKIRVPNIIPINSDNQFTMVILIKNSVFEEAREVLNDSRNKSFIELAKDCKKKIIYKNTLK